MSAWRVARGARPRLRSHVDRWRLLALCLAPNACSSPSIFRADTASRSRRFVRRKSSAFRCARAVATSTPWVGEAPRSRARRVSPRHAAVCTAPFRPRACSGRFVRIARGFSSLPRIDRIAALGVQATRYPPRRAALLRDWWEGEGVALNERRRVRRPRVLAASCGPSKEPALSRRWRGWRDRRPRWRPDTSGRPARGPSRRPGLIHTSPRC